MGSTAAEPGCGRQAQLTEAAERAAEQGRRARGRPALCGAGAAGAAPGLAADPPAPPQGRVPLPAPDAAGAVPIHRAPRNPRPPGEARLPHGTGDPPTGSLPPARPPGAPKGAQRGVPQARHIATCRPAAFPGAGRGGTAPGQPPQPPLQSRQGCDTRAPRSDKVYEHHEGAPRCGHGGGRLAQRGPGWGQR